MKIAIIGSGIAGLTAAWMLSRSGRYHVTLLERQPRIGMDAHCLRIPDGDQHLVADVPSRMFNASQWPQLMGLYNQLGVQHEAVHSNQSFTHDDGRQRKCYLRLDVAHRPTPSFKAVFSRDLRAVFRDARRLMRQGQTDLADRSSTAPLGDEDLGSYLARHRFSDAFINQFLYPTLSSTVCTCSYANLDRYPARIILSTLDKLTDVAGLRRVTEGTQAVVDKLVAVVDEVRVGVDVGAIRETSGGVQIEVSGQSPLRFDQVIVATQADTAKRLLPELSAAEQAILSDVNYESTAIVVHCDESLMPPRHRDWSTFNMLTGGNRQDRAATCTVWMNQFHRWDRGRNVFQTIVPDANLTDATVAGILPEKVIDQVVLRRAVVDSRSSRSVARLMGLQQQLDRKIWFAGSWAAEGIPLLETGVVAARRCVSAINRNFAPQPM